MNMRTLWTLLGIALVAAQPAFLHAGEGKKSTKSKKKRMNVVLIFTDDQGYSDVGCFGAKGFKTPNLDRMAKQGVKFSSFYVSTAVCSASRSALMTGCYHTRVDIHGAFGPGRVGLHPDEMTIAELLKQIGYSSGCFGKWHLGSVPDLLPTAQGFDEYFGLPYSNDMSPSPKNNPRPQARKRYPPLPLISGTKVIEREPDQSKLTKWYTEKAVKFIKKNKNRPFFCYVAHSMPHVPLYASKKFKGKTKSGLYGDVITEIDWSVGQILETLKKEGLDENTLVIFTSDNGPWLTFGNHGGTAFPLREGKGTIFEGGVRIPCIMRWPGKMPAGHVCNEPAMTIDILPTLAKLTGAKLPKHKIDGKNIWPLMKGEKEAKSPHEAYYFWYARELRAVRMGKWKFHFPHRYRTLTGPPGMDGVPKNQGSAKIGLSLFDLEKDIGEKKNVAKQHPDVVAKIKKLAQKMRERLGDRLTKTKGREVRPLGKSKLPPLPKGKKRKGKSKVSFRGGRSTEIMFSGSTVPSIPRSGGKTKQTEPQSARIEDLIAAVQSGDANTRQRAFDRLQILGPKAKAAVPALVEVLEKGKTQDKVNAAQVLGAIGKEAKKAVPTLVKHLDSKEYALVRQCGLSLLQIQGPTLKTTTKLLAWEGKGPDQFSHYWTYLQGAPIDVTPYLIHLMQSEKKRVRANAAGALGSLLLNTPTNGQQKAWEKLNKSAQSQVISGLEKLLKDPEVGVAQAAVSSFVRLAPDKTAKAIPVAVRLLGKKRISSYDAYLLLRGAAKEAIDPLIRALDTKDRVVQQQVAYTLGGLAPLSVPKLISSLKNKSSHVRAGAALALSVSSSRSALDPLRKALKDPSEEVRLNAAQALLRMSPRSEAKVVVPVLRGALTSQDAEFRARAALNLSVIPKTAKDALPQLLRTLNDKQLRVRVAAARAVIAIDPNKTAATVPTISDALKSEKFRLQGGALASKIGGEAKRIVPELTATLRQELKKVDMARANVDRDLISFAARALGNAGPKAKKAVPLLVEALDVSYDPEAIGYALAQLGAPEAKLAVRALLLSTTRAGSNLLFPNFGKTLQQPQLKKQMLVGRFPGVVASDLLKLLDDQQTSVRQEAAKGLGILYDQKSPLRKELEKRFSQTTKQVIPKLRKTLSDKEVRVQVAAGRALVRIDPTQAQTLVPKLVLWLSDSRIPRYEVVRMLRNSKADPVDLLIGAFDEVPDPTPIAGLLTRSNFLPKAIPQLGQALKSKSARKQAGAAHTLAEFARTTPKTKSYEQAWEAAEAAVPTLQQLLQDNTLNVRFEAARALLNINRDRHADAIHKVFIQALQDKNGAMRYRAVYALGRMGPKASEAIPVLNKALQSKNTAFVLEVSRAIIAVSPKQAYQAIAKLKKVLTSGNALYAREAAQALASLGKYGKTAIPALKQAMGSKIPSVQFEAGRAMTLIDPDQTRVVLPRMIDLLKSERTSPYMKRTTLEFLVSVPNKKAVPALEPLLRATDEQLKLSAALALVKIAPKTMKKAWGVVSSTLTETQSQDTRDEIFETLTKLGPKAQPAIPAVVSLLKAKSRSVRREAIYVLGGMGAAAKKAIPDLRKVLFDTENPDLVRAAQLAIRRIQNSKE